MNKSLMKTIPIKIAGSTLAGYNGRDGFPIEGGNCFDLRDVDGSNHRVVNFGYENLKEWMKRTGQTDIKVRCIPKSDVLWEICDERIPIEWYTVAYCTTCTPIRMLPFEQRKEYVKNKTFKKVHMKDGQWWVLISTNIRPTDRKLSDKWTFVQDTDQVLTPYIPKRKKPTALDVKINSLPSEFASRFVAKVVNSDTKSVKIIRRKDKK